jgi:CheY-like chemotaxis protein
MRKDNPSPIAGFLFGKDGFIRVSKFISALPLHLGTFLILGTPGAVDELAIAARSKNMPGHPGSRKIMVVDDEETIADTLALIFSSNGYDARSAYSAEEALEMLEVWKPDCAIIDVVLPGMNGIEFAIFLKASYPDVHFLLFSGQPGTGGLLEEAKKKGHLFEILAKPLHPTFMLATVANMLSSPPLDASHLPN